MSNRQRIVISSTITIASLSNISNFFGYGYGWLWQIPEIKKAHHYNTNNVMRYDIHRNKELINQMEIEPEGRAEEPQWLTSARRIERMQGILSAPGI